jgi:hypothetical protein
MSDYKEIETQVELVNENQLIRSLETLLGQTPERNVLSRNKWNHTRQLNVCLREAQLPEHLQGYGDVGFELKNGKFVPIGISDQDSHYIDNAKRLPVGTFTGMMNDFFGEVENTYALLDQVDVMTQRTPGVKFGNIRRPQDEEDSNAMGIEFEIDSDYLATLGVRLPA